MDVASAIDIVRSRYKALVEDPYTLPSLHDNEKEVAPPTDSRYARVAIVTDLSTLQSLGNPQRWRTPGGLIIELHEPLNTGDKDLKELAAAIIPLFSGKKVDGITYRNAGLNMNGCPDGKTWQGTVTCEFHFDEYRAL